MTLIELSFTLSIIALVISIWARFEAYFITRRQHQVEQAKRIGEALISAQMLKNTLSDNIDEFDKVLRNDNVVRLNAKLVEEFSNRLSNIKNEYDKVWEDLKVFECATLEIAKGQKTSTNVASMEAIIAHFNQRKALAQFDIQYLNSFWQRYQISLTNETVRDKENCE
jgi:hypothetical protein